MILNGREEMDESGRVKIQMLTVERTVFEEEDMRRCEG